MLKLFKAKSLKKTQETENISLNERTQEKDKKQRGRSMVEMLGVLAIIGVLSIGGIQGYTMAMRRYRANEIINIVSKYAMVLYSGCQQAMEKDPQNYGVMSENTNFTGGGDGSEWSKGFWLCPGVKFTDAGLGALPSGVLKIGPDADNTGVNNYFMSNGWDERKSVTGATIKSLSSGDAVAITVQFETKELCETVMGITGKPVDNGYGGGNGPGMVSGGRDATCGNAPSLSGNNGYYLAIVTMMN